MKTTDLHELIRYITKNVIKEYSMLSTSSDKSSTGDITDPNAPPIDAMTSYEKLKAEREKEKQHQRDIRSRTLDIKSTDTQSKYFDQQLKQNKLKKTAQQKELQNLKAGKTVSVGGAGSINP